jgi:hypothetical protein
MNMGSGGKIIQPKVMTVEEMEADAKTPEQPKVEPPKEETPKEETPAPETEPQDESDSLKSKLAELEARNAELLKRVRDEDGRTGGKLAALQTDMARVADQLRQVMDENRELRKVKEATPEVPPEKDSLEEEYPEVAKGIDRRAKPAIEAATRAEQLAKQALEENKSLREAQSRSEYTKFLDTIKAAVPDMDDINNDPAFADWCAKESPGSPFSRQKSFEVFAAQRNAGKAVELYHLWKSEKTNATNAEPDAPKGQAKPSKEAQVAVPKSSAGAAVKPKGKSGLQRLKEIEDKCFKFGTATAEDRLEYDRLLDAQERGELSA